MHVIAYMFLAFTVEGLKVTHLRHQSSSLLQYGAFEG